ncbi:MAG: HEAT repeat domain-containing protein, partial [Chthoniobacteraceae bacterium]
TAPLQREWLGDRDDAVRYWAAAGLHARPQLDAADRKALRAALTDQSPVVRIEAASALASHGEGTAALPVLTAALRDESPEVALHAARALELLGPAAKSAQPEMQARLATAREAEARGEVIAMFIRFSLEAALAH